MKMTEKVFRAYDIRGIYPRDIDEKFALNIGKAFGTYGNGKVVVGMDSRLSSPSLKKEVIKGLVSSGSDVMDIGTVITPMVLFSTVFYRYDGGIMITASHNPKQWNGFLFSDNNGMAISYERGLKEIEKIFEGRNFSEGEFSKGKVNQKNVIDDYSDFMIRKLGVEDPINMKVVVDAGNGSAGKIAPHILRKIGVKVQKVFCELDGKFPNREPEPRKGNLDEIKKEVLKNKADLGLAYDGDGDRLVAIDEKGNILEPNQLFSIFVKSYLEKNKEKIVHDALTSDTIPELVKNYNGLPVRCRVGRVFIASKVANEEAALAGEISGHYYFREMFGADDAMFASLKLIKFLADKGKKLSESYNLPDYIFGSRRVKVKEREKFEFIENIKNRFKGYELDLIDGVKVIFDGGWALFRPSNTESKISISYEARDRENFREIEKFVNNIVEDIPRQDKSEKL